MGVIICEGPVGHGLLDISIRPVKWLLDFGELAEIYSPLFCFYALLGSVFLCCCFYSYYYYYFCYFLLLSLVAVPLLQPVSSLYFTSPHSVHLLGSVDILSKLTVYLLLLVFALYLTLLSHDAFYLRYLFCLTLKNLFFHSLMKIDALSYLIVMLIYLIYLTIISLQYYILHIVIYLLNK